MLLKILQTIFKEPLLYFLLISSTLFYLNYEKYLQESAIVLDDKTVNYIIAQREKIILKPLSKEEKKSLIKEYINNELLYQEAILRGLDNDSRIKKQMIQKMIVLLTSEVKEPSDKELRAFFQANKERYTQAAAHDFDQVFFSKNSKVPNNFLDQLEKNETEARESSDKSIFFGNKLYHMDSSELLVLLGKEATQSLLEIDDKLWHGPIESKLGVHFVRLAKVYPKREAKFEEIKEYLQQDYIISKHKKQLATEIDKLRKKHDIVVKWPN